MIFADPSDLRSAEQPYDICVVGAGAAGISLALELDGGPCDVCVLEAGEIEYDKSVQRLFEGEATGDRFPALRDTRMGALGGTTTVWAGWCRPLEPFDFAGRPDVGACAWPFSRRDLASAYRRAAELCGLGCGGCDVEEADGGAGSTLLPLDHAEIVHRPFQVHARRFGEAHRRRLGDSPNVSVYLRAPVLRLVPAAGGSRIQYAVVRTPQGKDQVVAADVFVLAGGGIENPRMLLLSAECSDRAPGNGRGLVGRFFADHPFLDPGELVLNSPSDLARYFPKRSNGVSSSARDVLSFREHTLNRERMLNGAIFFYPRYESHPTFQSVEGRAFVELVNKLRGKAVPGDALGLLPTALRAPGGLMTVVLRRLLVRQRPATRWRLRAMFETEFRQENCVKLTTDRDELGRPRPRVRWRLGDMDLSSMMRATNLLDRELRSSGTGRIELAFPNTPDDWRAAAEGGKHHMGTTRMHREPALGVVDHNSRVHGTANLYVTGSSVFPSGGYANPTLTIVALAVRLAQHLKNTVA